MKKLPRGRGTDTAHLHTAEVAAKRQTSLKGSAALSAAMKDVHQRRIASGEDAAIRAKIKATRIAKGDWIDSPLSAFQEYRKAVRRVTSSQDILSLDNADRRGRGPGKYHLDHIVSCKSGFEQGLPPEIIGDIANLRFITEAENCSKQGYNDIDEVINLYFRRTHHIEI